MRFFHPKRILRLTKQGFHDLFWYYLVPDKLSIAHSFKERIGRPCDFKDPRSYNEKIQWLKLHDRKPFYKNLCDKYEVKQIVGDWIGQEYIIPTLGRWQRFENIDFDILPDKFVLKCNHDSASVVICRDKATFDREKARRKLNAALRHDYYHDVGKQWAYKGIPRCILAESFIEDIEHGELVDYKFMVFNGTCRCTLVGSDRFSPTGPKMDFYDREWNLMPFIRHYPNSKEGFEKPSQYDLMVSLAETVAHRIGNPFVRVDFYQVGKKVYFGEVTFYPGGGFSEFTPEEWDETIGSWIDLKQC